MSDVIEKNDNDDEISLIDLLIVLARNKKLLILPPICVGIIAAICTMFMPNIYTASVKLMPPQQGGSSSAVAMLSQLGGGLGGLAGGALGIKNPGDLYVGMFRSRTITDRMIARFKLKDRFKANTMAGARDRLQKLTAVTTGKDGLISLDFEDEDPKFAADVANAYVEELDRLMQGLAVTEAGQRRLYFEKQLKRTKDELARAEFDLRKTQEKTGLIDPSAQGKAIIESIATLRAQIASREVTLGSMKSFATERNPDAVRIRSEIDELRNQLAKLEKPSTDDAIKGDMAIPSGKVPEVGLEYTRNLREVKYHEVLFELMAKQYEMARADEARDSGSLQIVDKAVPSDQKSKPKRGMTIIVSIFLSFVLMVIAVFLKEAKGRIASTETGRLQFAELKKHMFGRQL